MNLKPSIMTYTDHAYWNHIYNRHASRLVRRFGRNRVVLACLRRRRGGDALMHCFRILSKV